MSLIGSWAEKLKFALNLEEIIEINMAPQDTRLTEELLCKVGGNQLKKITNLSLCNHGIRELNVNALNKLTSLKSLDLSANEITEVPDDLCLKQLTTLGCADNELTSIQFVKNFPSLTRLEIDGNPSFGLLEKCLAIELCPGLREVDNCKRSFLEKHLKNCRNKWETQMITLWEVLFAAEYCKGIPDDKVQLVQEEFISKTKKDQLYSVPTKLDDYMINKLSGEIIQAAKSGKIFSAEKHVVGTPRSARLNKLIDNGTPSKYSQTSPNKSQLASKPSTPGGDRSSKKRPRESSPSSDRKNEKRARLDISDFTVGRLPPLPDYDPLYFVRCHSENNSPSDENTKIWQCAFEPKSSIISSGNIVATCGGNIVCLIDCQTGKVMKRYKDIGEDFYTLAWTSITVDIKSEEKTNILAVAGHKGQIRLMHPSQLISYATLIGHKKYISCLTFHPEKPTTLFSGSTDGIINVWDIGIPDFVDYSTKYQLLMTLSTDRLDVVGLVVSSYHNMLLAACEGACLAWKLNKPAAKKIRQADFRFELPTVDDEEMKDETDDHQVVDGLVLLPNNTVVTKCVGDSCLYTWDLSSNLPKSGSKTKSVNVKTSAMLQYTNVNTDFMYLGAEKDVLAVGDDRGSVHLFNMENLIKKNSAKSDEILEASRLLDWPDLDVGQHKETMTELQKNKDVVINCVCISKDKNYIVCGTDNNIVCIWKKC